MVKLAPYKRPLLLPRMRVGIFGGSFNPAHEGHTHVATVARKRLGLDSVIWMVSPQNPLKSAKGMASFEERFESALHQATHPRDHVSDLEVRLRTPFTVDTLTNLCKRYPHVQFVWLMGADNLKSFHRWKLWRRIAETLPIAVIARPTAIQSPLSSQFAQSYDFARVPETNINLFWEQGAPAWTFLHERLNYQSSTQIRANRLKAQSAEPKT